MSKLICFLLAICIAIPVFAQKEGLSQTIRGVVIDKTSEKPLAGVTVQVVDITPRLSAVTDEGGRYVIVNVPPGRHQFAFESVGYQPAVIPEVLVTSGKEVILDISLEQKLVTLDAFTVSAPITKKGAATNEFTAGSARSFSLEEVTRYAGGKERPVEAGQQLCRSCGKQ